MLNKNRLLRVAFALSLPCIAQTAFAHDSNDSPKAKNPARKQCIKDANAAHKLAIQAANDERKLAQLICDAESPEEIACLQACASTRKECLSAAADKSARKVCRIANHECVELCEPDDDDDEQED